MSTAEQQRRWRAAQGARIGQPGRPAVKPCGTLAAYRRHLKAGETPCDECRAANADYAAQHRYANDVAHNAARAIGVTTRRPSRPSPGPS